MIGLQLGILLASDLGTYTYFSEAGGATLPLAQAAACFLENQDAQGALQTVSLEAHKEKKKKQLALQLPRNPSNSGNAQERLTDEEKLAMEISKMQMEEQKKVPESGATEQQKEEQEEESKEAGVVAVPEPVVARPEVAQEASEEQAAEQKQEEKPAEKETQEQDASDKRQEEKSVDKENEEMSESQCQMNLDTEPPEPPATEQQVAGGSQEKHVSWSDGTGSGAKASASGGSGQKPKSAVAPKPSGAAKSKKKP